MSRVTILRLLPCVVYVISMAVLIVCLRLNQMNWTTNPPQTRWISSSRSIIQIIIGVIASLFAWRQVAGMLRLINLHQRRRLSSRPFPLKALASAHALSSKSWGVNLPYRVRAGVTFLVLLEITIASLFVAVLTPVTAEQKISVQNVSVPFYPNDPDGTYYNRTWDPFAAPNTVRNSLGSFSWVPGNAFAGPLLRTLGSATNVNGTARVHAKDDASQYSYSGRSYGVGASVGLYTPIQRNSSAARSSYQEQGYLTNVSCIMNRSSLWTIDLTYETQNPTYPDFFLAQGNLPNTAMEEADMYSSTSLMTKAELCHIISRCAGGRCMLAVAARSYKFRVPNITPNSMLDKVQCEVKFIPSMFDVTTDHTQQLITVVPRSDLPAQDIDPTVLQYGKGRGRLQEWAMWQPTLLSMIQTTLYATLYGDALVQNVYNYQDAHSRTRQTMTDSDITGGVQESFAAMFDDILLYFSSAMLVLGPKQSQTPVMITFNAFKLGDSKFVIAALTFSIIPLVIYILCSAQLIYAPTDWDVENISDIVKASYLGGVQKGQETPASYPADVAQSARELTFKDCVLSKTDHGYSLVPTTATTTIINDWSSSSLLYHIYNPEIHPLSELR